MQVGSNGGIR